MTTLNAEAAANLGNLQECEGSLICMETHDDCGADHVQLVANPSGSGPTPVPIHSGVNVDLPFMDLSSMDGGQPIHLYKLKMTSRPWSQKICLKLVLRPLSQLLMKWVELELQRVWSEQIAVLFPDL